MRNPTLANLVFTFCTAIFSSVWAAVPAPPPTEALRDSAALRWEEGAELTRSLGTARFEFLLPAKTRANFHTDWITGISRGLSSEGRVRHDVRWNSSVSRKLDRKFAIWGGASGQHYVDKPRQGAQSFAQENKSHLVRAGFGPIARWNRALKSSHSFGAVSDTRESVTQSGIGTWNSGEFDLESSRQLRHEAEAHFDYEAPGSREGADAGLVYALRQNYDEASNNVDVSLAWTKRDVLLSETVPPQLREERLMRVSDELIYQIAKGTVLRGEGDIRYQDTHLDDRRGSASDLKELESGLNTELAVERNLHSAALSIGVRDVNQSVRGEILSGRKTELAVRGLSTQGKINLRARAAFSKYTLDTRSDQNFDDRDELTWRFETGASAPVFPGLRAHVTALIDLNHLVYIYGRNSANNRWTRLFLLTSRFVHRPSETVLHVPEFRISANYQAYDFELNPRQVRSTVFRRVTIGDSVAYEFVERWSVSLQADLSREELGRLYWEQFEEERSDRTDVFSSAIEFTRKLTAKSLAGAGLAYSSRKSDRFESGDSPLRVLDIESWGPIARLQWFGHSWFVQGSGQFVMQKELGRDDRDFISGSLTAGRTW